MTTDENIPSEDAPKPEQKPQKLNKNGQPRKALSEEDAKRRAEILRLGREKALAKKKALKENPPTKPVSFPIPKEDKYVEKKVEQDIESEPETIKVMSKPKKTKQKKKVYVYEDSSSSSEEEIVVRKKKNKKRSNTPSPSPPPAPSPAQPVVKPSPQPSAEEIEKIRKEKIRRFKEMEKKDKLMTSIFG